MRRYRHLGLQKRIMLYVAVGLTVMFGVVAVLGLDAIDEATRLVYRERLSTAHTTAGILERVVARVAATIEAGHADLFPGSGSRVPAGTATRLLARFQRTPDEYPYFAIGGVWILDGAGRVLDAAGGRLGQRDPAIRRVRVAHRLVPAEARTHRGRSHGLAEPERAVGTGRPR